MPVILKAIEKTNAKQYTLDRAKFHSDLAAKAIKNFPENAFHDSLVALTEFVFQREF